MKFETTDLAVGNIDKVAALFPNVITETKDANGSPRKAINFELLKQMLADEVIEGNEAYEFTWVGKKASIREAHKSIRKTLRPCKEESVDWDTTQNLYIEGDNLEVLKLLQESYLGKVKMIYIDPPYNTGNDFIYEDDFKMSAEEYADGTGEYDDEGNRLVKNPDTNGRFHSDWCSMMYSRLLVARNLLSDDGAIFISIDDHEQANLKKICDEVFGKANFVALIPWRKRTAKSDVPFGVSQDYEWIICYAKSSAFVASVQGKERKYYETEDFPGCPWRYHDLTKQTTIEERPNSNFSIVNPKNGEEYPVNPSRSWAITQDTFWEYYNADRIIFPGDYDFLNISKPVLRYWQSDDMDKAGEHYGRIAVSTKLPDDLENPLDARFVLPDDIGMSQSGTKEITSLFDAKVFSFPKPSNLIKFLVSINTKESDLVLDFFSGSASCAHAVMQLNAEDKYSRRFIMVQLPEVCDKKSVAFINGYDTICEIGKERIRRAAVKLKAEHRDWQGDTGFRVLKVDSTNMKNVYYSADEYSQVDLSDWATNIKEDRTDMDLLFQCLLEWGLPLSLPHSSEKIEGYSVHDYNNGDLIACFEKDIPEEVIRTIAHKQPLRAVFRDNGFADDATKINVEEIFKLLAPSTRIKVI